MSLPTTLPGQFVLAGAIAFALWLVLYGVAALATRNGAVVPGRAGQELGADPESPAVVSLLGNNWRSVNGAAAATLLDLAARGLVELRQPGDDPAQTTVHVAEHARTDHLAPYELRVLARVAEQAKGGGAPIGAIAFRGEQQAAAWNAGLRKEITAEARQLGLSRPRLRGVWGNLLVFTAFVPAVLFGLSVIVGHHNVRAAFFIGAASMIPQVGLMSLLLTERATAHGLARAGHWAGVRSWLGAHEEFAQLPPASVAVWDRYLGYGTALGVVSLTSRLLGFDSGDRRRVWSDFGGTWREVRIRYPWLRPGFGGTTNRLLQLAGATGLVAAGLLLFAELRSPDWAVTTDPHSLQRPGLVLNFGWVVIGLLGLLAAGKVSKWLPLLAFLATMPGAFADVDGWWGDTMNHHGPAPVELAVIVAFGALMVTYLVFAWLSLRTAVTVTGEVLRLERRSGKQAVHLVALDEGTTDRTVAWALRPGTAPAERCAPGSKVRLTVNPHTRVITSIEAAGV